MGAHQSGAETLHLDHHHHLCLMCYHHLHPTHHQKHLFLLYFQCHLRLLYQQIHHNHQKVNHLNLLHLLLNQIEN